MEVGKGQRQESFSNTFQYENLDDDDDDDGHFVIALEDTGQDTDELDGGRGGHDLTAQSDCVVISPATPEPQEDNGLCGHFLFNNDSENVSGLHKTQNNKSVPDSDESLPLSLHLECTADDDEQNRYCQRPVLKETGDNDHAHTALKMPNFLMSSPEIIKRLKSTLLERPTVSDSGRLLGSTPVTDSNSISNKTAREAARKLDFSPRDDCECIMCHGWDPSKFAAPLDSCISVIQSPHTSTDQQHLPTHPAMASECFSSASNTSVFNVIKSNVQTSQCGDSTAQGKLSHNSCSDHSLLSSCSSILTKTNAQQSFPTVSTSGNFISEPPRAHRKTSSQYRGNVILKANGSFYVLVPEPSMTTRQSVTLVKKMIPEVKSKDAKILFLTHDFVKCNRPDLKTLLSKSTKVDFSILGTVSIHVSDTDLERSSPAQVLTSQSSLFPGLNMESAKQSLSNSDKDLQDALIQLVQSHLRIDVDPLAAKSPTTLTPPRSVTQLSKLVNMPRQSASTASVNTNKSSTQKTNIILLQHGMSKLPPPPPLLRRPGVPAVPRESCVSATLSRTSYPRTAIPMSQISYSGTATVPMSQTSYSGTAISLGGMTTTANISSDANSFPTNLVLSPSSNTAALPSTHGYNRRSPIMSNNNGFPGTLLQHNGNITRPEVLNNVSAANEAHSMHIEEPREILVIPVVSKAQTSDTQNLNDSINRSFGVAASSHVYKSKTPPSHSPKKTVSLLRNTPFASRSESLKLGKSSVSTTSTTSAPRDDLKSPTTCTASFSTVSSSLSHTVCFEPRDTYCNDVSNQPLSDASFPAVVKVNLSSCANMSLLCSPSTLNVTNCHTASTSTSSSVLPSASKHSTMSIKSDLLQETYSLSKPISSPTPWVASASPPNFLTQPSQTTTSRTKTSCSALLAPGSESFTGKASRNLAHLSTSTQQSSSIPTNECSVSQTPILSSMTIQKDLLCATTCSSPTFVKTTESSTITKAPQSTSLCPSYKGMKVSSSEHSTSVTSSMTYTSSSSVSVDGLKLKIRLGDTKNTLEAGEPKSEKGLDNANTSQIRRIMSCDQNEKVEENSSAKRIETAEEMFQRYQEQAMQEVYNAQFGVGNLSRSLRPSRSNISFVDKSIPVWRIGEGKKKKLTDNNDVNKTADDGKNHYSTNELQGHENSKSVVKTNKKRHTSSESRCEISTNEPTPDINDFPRLQEDNSILFQETIVTPNIMAGHKVFVKFNVFSNPQSGRSFLVPFFNLGGSRVQFDNEDMDYIKTSVVEFEKDERFCARHLIYYSRENKKASFLRKENSALINDLSEKSYNKYSYILEGFSREPTKKTIPPPEEWKVDKKVSIEIDTADVDSNVVIDFEDSLANATVSERNGVGNEQATLPDSNSSNMCSDYSRDLLGQEDEDSSNFARDNFQHVDSLHPNSKNTQSAFHNVVTKVSPLPTTKSSNHHPIILRKKETVQDLNADSNSAQLFNSFTSESPMHNYEVGDTDHDKEVTTFDLPQSSDSTSKTTNPSPSISYTDQLKALFSSGNLHDIVPSMTMQSEASTLSTLTCTSIKEEIVDDEYFLQSNLPPSQTNANSALSDSSTMSAANTAIKSEPTDAYYESLERGEVRSSSPTIVQKDNDIFKDHPKSWVSTDRLVKFEHAGEGQLRAHDQDCDGEETISALSASPTPSSAVAESSHISSSSCIDTSEDDSDGDHENSEYELSTPLLSFMSNPSESPALLNVNLPHNSSTTKITSLVESLKQRLSENSKPITLTDSTEPIKQSKCKRKKNKVTKHRTMDHLVCPDETTDMKDPTADPAVDQSSDGVTAQKNVASEAIPSAQFLSSTPTTPMSSSIPKTLEQNSTSFSGRPEADAVASFTTPTLDQEGSIGTGDDLAEFRARFPFITSGEQQCSRALTWVNGVRNTRQQSVPGDSLDKETETSSDQTLENQDLVVQHVQESSPKQSITNSRRFHSVSNLKEYNDSLASTPCDDNEFDSAESDIDVGTEDVTSDQSYSTDLSRAKELLSSPPLSTQGRNYLRDFTKENEFTVPKKSSNDHEQVCNNNSGGNEVSKTFTLPIRPRNKTKTVKPKIMLPEVTKAPSTASLLCQKLDIAVETIVPKLKGKITSPLNSISFAEVHRDVPKPINPGFKPSINAIFGVPDIPKSIETVINKPISFQRSVAKKSSSKSNRVGLSRQVATKRTAGKCANNVKQQKVKAPTEKKTQIENDPHVTVSVNKNQTDAIDTKTTTDANGTSKTKGIIHPTVLDKTEPKLPVAWESAQIPCQTPSQSTTLPITKEGHENTKALNIRLKKLDDKVNRTAQSETKSSSIGQHDKPSQSPKNVRKGSVQKKKQIKGAKTQPKKQGLNNMKKQLVSDSKGKAIHNSKKSGSKQKSGVANRKLGTLLIEFNRYSSLRKFAWRKYSTFKEKAYIIETGENDSIPEIVETATPKELKKEDDDNKGVGESKNNTSNFNLKPCKLLLHRLEDMEWDSKEIPIKTESGTYIIKPLQSRQKRSGVSETIKRRKKKSTLQTYKNKKGSSKPKGAKKDIVDYYAAAIESLRKKALLLEEDEKKKAEETDMGDHLVIKTEVVEPQEMNESEDISSAITLETCSDGIEDHADNEDDRSLLEDDQLKDHELLEASMSLPVTDDREVLNNEDALVLDEKCQVLNDKTSAENSSPFTSGENLKKHEENPVQSNIAIDKESTVLLKMKSVNIVERNYEGDTIQALTVRFHDQVDVEDGSKSDGNIDQDLQEDTLSGFTQREEIEDIELSIADINSQVIEDVSKSSDEQNRKDLWQDKLKASDSRYEICGMEESDDVKDKTDCLVRKTCLEPDIFDIIERDVSCNDGVLAVSNDERKSEDTLAEVKESATPESRKECNGDVLAEAPVSPDCNFVPKDIVLGFEDELGTETENVLSKLTADVDDEMFLLGDEDDGTENIGLIPDEEVEKLLGLDVKEGEGDLSAVKRNEDKKAREGTTGTNTSKLSWRILPENLSVEGESKTNTGADSEQTPTEKYELLSEHALTIDTHSAGSIGSLLSPEKSNLVADNQPANISPSWKRILGSQALKEIEQSVSSTIAASTVNNTQDQKGEKLKPRLQTDKLKLKLCTGALSKALKLSAEMRKTFADNSNESNTNVKKKENESVLKCDTKSQAECKESHNDQGSCTSSVDQGNNTLLSGLSRKGLSANHEGMKSVSFPHEDHSSSLETSEKNLHSKTSKTAVKVGKNTIDLTKLKMKLTPILASAKARFTINDSLYIQDESRKIQTNDHVHVPTSEEWKTSVHGEAKKNPVEEIFHLKQSAIPDDETMKSVKPLVNTEKLPNIAKTTKTVVEVILHSKQSSVPDVLATKKLKPLVNTGKFTNKAEESKTSVKEILHSKQPFEHDVKATEKVKPLVNTGKLTNIAEKRKTVVEEIIGAKQPFVPDVEAMKKVVKPLVNTEKLTNILKNFKKPLNLNLPSSSKKTLNLSRTSPLLETVTTPCSKTPIFQKQKSPTRKRTRSALSASGKSETCESKRSKITAMGQPGTSKLTGNETVVKDSEDDKGERSFFDCLSELTPNA